MAETIYWIETSRSLYVWARSTGRTGESGCWKSRHDTTDFYEFTFELEARRVGDSTPAAREAPARLERNMTGEIDGI